MKKLTRRVVEKWLPKKGQEDFGLQSFACSKRWDQAGYVLFDKKNLANLGFYLHLKTFANVFKPFFSR